MQGNDSTKSGNKGNCKPAGRDTLVAPAVPFDYSGLGPCLKAWGRELGFADVAVARAQVGEAAGKLQSWLDAGCHGGMDYMAKHAHLRADPQALVPGTLTVISVRLPYLPQAEEAGRVLADGESAYISRYALGRDYHKVIRNRLQKLADRLAEVVGPFGYRVFSDSAPVMEIEFASQAGLGWRGKHTLLLTRTGSWHFLGEIYTDLPLIPDQPVSDHCGACTRCLAACPTQAITAPYRVDARRCISYLTIEHDGPIPEALRPLMGNRIYGCDDCQLCCPWNRFASPGDPEFAPRQGLDSASLANLFAWSEADFLERLAGSPIRRIGIERWRRNIAIALGNAPGSQEVISALLKRQDDPSSLVREHVAWALRRHSGD
ncbi:MAG: tRNA epoxyqueuosine(34) reductase QueG [Betaproteobacteria bacterium]|nr:tRNA epoxyqueuosine(34) reductase QueG [Betaproteobacteria bacterium]